MYEFKTDKKRPNLYFGGFGLNTNYSILIGSQILRFNRTGSVAGVVYAWQ